MAFEQPSLEVEVSVQHRGLDEWDSSTLQHVSRSEGEAIAPLLNSSDQWQGWFHKWLDAMSPIYRLATPMN